MFDWVDMDVVDVTGEIVLVANGMLPLAPLPDATLAFGGAAIGNPFAFREAARKRRFDQPPACGEISIPRSTRIIKTGRHCEGWQRKKI